MKYLIIAGGEAVQPDLLLRLSKQADRIICADSGAEIARRNNIVPNAIIGDFDSLSEGTITYFKRNEMMEVIEAYEQENTDLEKALILCLSRDAAEIIITCATGLRNDHLLHNIGLLMKYQDRAELSIIDDTDKLQIKSESFEMECSPGERISLIPWGGIVKNVTTKGLSYPIYGDDLIPGRFESISNEAEGDSFSVNFDSGIIVLIRQISKSSFADPKQIKMDF